MAFPSHRPAHELAGLCTACGGPLPADQTARLCPRCALAAFDDVGADGSLKVPGYEVGPELAHGGMGAVYRARQLRPGRDVALKILLPQFAEDDEMLARFQIEARAMAALDHPGVLPVYEVGEAGGMPFFSMKLATGGSLATRLTNGPLPPREAAALVAQLASAVHYAHQHGVLHRDLKPANFLFDEDGRAYVSDFGLAKLPLGATGAVTRTAAFLGTPHYMPPEVAGGSLTEATVAGDLYSLGAVLYECLTGRRPHAQREQLGPLLRAIVDEPIPPARTVLPTVPRDLEIICQRALEKPAAGRYPSVAAFADDLQRWLDGRPINARPVGSVEKTWRWARGHPLSASLACLLLAVSIAGGVLLALSHRERGVALAEARQRLHRSLIDQARALRLLGAPGHRSAALNLLNQAAALAPSAEIHDEAAALLAQPDVTAIEDLLAGEEPAAADSPQEWERSDPASDRRVAASGGWSLSFHASGRTALWKHGATKPDRVWLPADGRAIIGEFVPDGSAVVLAETESGCVLVRTSGDENPTVLLAPGAVVSFLALDPAGRRLALGRADGIEVIDLPTAAHQWRTEPVPVRCPPVWSADGSLLAAALGERRGAVIFDAASGASRLFHETSGWPRELMFHPKGRLIAIATDDGTLTLCETESGKPWATLTIAAHQMRFSSDGRELSAVDDSGRWQAWRLEPPVGFAEWTHPPRDATDGTVFSLALSPDHRRLLTTATAGVRVWSVAEGSETGFFSVENQRIDAPTAAWWLGGDGAAMLVQVPGGLERVPVDAAGKPGVSQRVARPPGSQVLAVRADGTWLVKSADEETAPYAEWSGGDPIAARPVVAPPAPEGGPLMAISADGRWSAIVREGDVIELISTSGGSTPLRLTPPEPLGVRGMLFSGDGRRLIVLGRQHLVFEWNLQALEEALRSLSL